MDMIDDCLLWFFLIAVSSPFSSSNFIELQYTEFLQFPYILFFCLMIARLLKHAKCHMQYSGSSSAVVNAFALQEDRERSQVRSLPRAFFFAEPELILVG